MVDLIHLDDDVGGSLQGKHNGVAFIVPKWMSQPIRASHTFLRCVSGSVHYEQPGRAASCTPMTWSPELRGAYAAQEANESARDWPMGTAHEQCFLVQSASLSATTRELFDVFRPAT